MQLPTKSIFFVLVAIQIASHASPISSVIESQNANGSFEVQKTYILSEQELELIQLVAQHPDQQRPAIYLDPALTIYANAKVDDLVNRQYFAHVDDAGNMITYYFGGALGFLMQTEENIAGGQFNADHAVRSWEGSTTGHKESMLGLERNGFSNPLRPFVGVALSNDKFNGDLYDNKYWSLSFSDNPGAYPSAANSPDAFANTDQFQLLFPDGVTPVNRNFNWVKAEASGIEGLYIEKDGTYTSDWFGHFKDLGGMYVYSDTLGLTYSVPQGEHGHWFFAYDQGWIWTDTTAAPHFWSRNRNNWATMDFEEHLIFDYNNTIWEDWTPDGPHVQIMSNARQTHVDVPVVIGWRGDDASNILVFTNDVNEAGDSVLYTNLKSGAYLWTPQSTGNFAFAILRQTPISHSNEMEEAAKNIEIQVLPAPEANAITSIQASSAEVSVDEIYTISWTSNGGIPIIRATPGIARDKIAGVFSNDANGSAAFSQKFPGIYTYSIHLGETKSEVVVKVNGTLTVPTLPRN